MRVLITNVQLDHRTGTEIVVRDLEAALRRRGHEVCIYTERPGLLSDEIADRGGSVVASLEDVPFVPDVIHGHHNATATAAAVRFPATPIIFVCHSRNFSIDMARGVPSVHRYVAVDLSCRERLLAEGVPADAVTMITNAVDLERFVVRPLCTLPPRRAAIFSNNAGDAGFALVVRQACQQVGLELDEFGSGVGRTLHDPEQSLASYDVVFAKARCAIEALAAGCAVIAVDRAGYGGLVTAAEVDRLLDWNIGDRCLQRAHDVATVVADVGRIDGHDVARVTQRVHQRCDLRVAVRTYEELYRSAVDPSSFPTGHDASWRGSHVDVLAFANDLELRLRAGEGVWSMPPLPPSVCHGLGLMVHRSPRRVAPGRGFTVDAELRNHSRENLASIGTTPVFLAYHWLRAGTNDIVEHDGQRTALTRPLAPGQHHRQSVHVIAPASAGDHTLRLTLVQEQVMWFTDLAVPIFVDVPVTVGADVEEWRLSDLASLIGTSAAIDHPIQNLGFVSSPLPEMLTFATTARYLGAARIAGAGAVIVPPTLADQVPEGVGMMIARDPGATFWRIHERLAGATDFYGRDEPTVVHSNAKVHASASIAECNVRIGEGAEIGAGSVITGRVEIGTDVRIGEGAVIGATGFQTAVVDERVVEFTHVGAVTIHDRVEVFANATIARGLFRQATSLGASSRIGNNAFVSHNNRVGPRSVVGHGAVINGNVTIGADVWIGPGARVTNNITIGDHARVDLGATVVGNLETNEHVGGPPAIDHRAVLREVATWRARGRRARHD